MTTPPALSLLLSVAALGACSEEGRALDSVVAPCMRPSIGLQLLALATFASALVLLVRHLSFRQLRSKLTAFDREDRLHRERARISRDIHDDVGNRLTTLTLLSELMIEDRSDPEMAGRHAREISDTVLQVTDSLDEIVWAVNPRYDTVAQVVSYIGQFAVQLTTGAGLRIRTTFPDVPPMRAISFDIRHNLFVATREALTNAIRGAGASAIALGITVEDDRLTLTVEDDGHGFDPGQELASRNGLAKMRERMDEIAGRLEIESAPGRGTRVVLHVPLPRA